jgi:hypothetical protein
MNSRGLFSEKGDGAASMRGGAMDRPSELRSRALWCSILGDFSS